MPAPQTVLTLVENFERNINAYCNRQYNVTQIKHDFVDPLFKVLGWDMDNSLGYAEIWDEIAAIFSQDAVLKGAFNKYADGTRGELGAFVVDSAFLEEVVNWRILLAHNIALRNPMAHEYFEINLDVIWDTV